MSVPSGWVVMIPVSPAGVILATEWRGEMVNGSGCASAGDAWAVRERSAKAHVKM